MKRIDVTKENALSHMHIRPGPSRLLIRSLMFCDIAQTTMPYLLFRIIPHIHYPNQYFLPFHPARVAKCNEFSDDGMDRDVIFVTAAAFILL
jgi:hypothetical protein